MKVIVNKKWILMKETWFRLESEADPKRKRETQMQKRDKLEEKNGKQNAKRESKRVPQICRIRNSERERELLLLSFGGSLGLRERERERERERLQ
jgi:hypothetical protein